MLYLFLALGAQVLNALVVLVDKYLISSRLVVKPVVYAFYANVFMFGALLAWPLSGEFLRGIDCGWALISGVGFGLGLWALFIATKDGETTHIIPFNGAIISIVVYFFSFSFLNEKLTGAQIVGMVVLLFASFILSWEKSARHKGFHFGFVWAIISGILFAISHVSAKYLYVHYPFWTGFVWSRATTGLVAIPLLLYPAVRNSLFKKSNNKKAKTIGKRYAGLIFFINKVFSVASVILIQYAAAIGSVTVVNALAGVQYALMFILAYLSSKFLRKVFQEYFTKREIITEMVAILLVIVGSVLFVL